MKKIPTLFHREFVNHTIKSITPEVDPSLEWVLKGEGVATEKVDGACCAIIDGIFYKRYDAKVNKKTGEFKNPPDGAIPCCDPDPVTGHWPHWVRIQGGNPDDHWFIEALEYTRDAYDFRDKDLEDGTYEAIGPHFNANPHKLSQDILMRHGTRILNDLTDRSFEGIKEYLSTHMIEGIVFWKDGEPQCKIKRSDFGFKWPGDDI